LPSVNGLSDTASIADLFTELANKGASNSILVTMEDECEAQLHEKVGLTADRLCTFVLGTNLVDKCILSLKSGKAPDYDGLTAEHLQYAHPCLTIII